MPTRFKTGARKSPRHKLLALTPHRVVAAPLSQSAFVPAKLDMWGNDQYGDCVTAEEAFARACYLPEIFVDAQTVEKWASNHGVLNGASLTEVLDAFSKGDGFRVGNQEYGCGQYFGVDYSNETNLKSALDSGPVKVAIDSSALPSSAGEAQGWFAVGGRPEQFQNTDHCVALCAHGPAGWLYQQLKVPLPSALSQSQVGYLLYTWATIGFVDHAWIMSTVVEAYLRNPTTVGNPPLTPPSPTPTPTPTPVPPPTPTPTPVTLPALSVRLQDAGGHYLTLQAHGSPDASGIVRLTGDALVRGLFGRQQHFTLTGEARSDSGGR